MILNIEFSSKTDDRKKEICEAYWAYEIDKYLSYIFKVKDIAEKYDLKEREVSKEVQGACLAHTHCEGCNKKIEVRTRGDFTNLIHNKLLGFEHKQVLCKECIKKYFEAKEKARIEYQKSLAKPVLHPIISNFKRKELFDKLKANFPFVFPSLRLATFLKINNYEVSSEFFNADLNIYFKDLSCSFVICDDNLIPVIAVDFEYENNNYNQSEWKRELKTKLLKSAGIEYYIMPKEEVNNY